LADQTAWMRALLQSLREAANAYPKSVPLDTFHSFSGWLKEVAPRKMDEKLVTLDTSHSFSGWLKDVAPRKMDPKVGPLDPSHSFSGWLTEMAPRKRE